MPKTLYHSVVSMLETKKLHIISWAIFIFYEVVITGVLLGHFSPLLSYLFFYTINISLFYIHAIHVLPYAFENRIKSLWRLPFLLVIELIIYFALAAIAEKLVYLIIGMSREPTSWKFTAATIWRGIYFMLYSTGYYFILNFIKNEKRINEEAIEKERLKNMLLRMEKDFLRAQINPHLLFNTLNFIKYAAKRKPENVEVAILTLSEIMSFAMDESNSEYLTLATELRQIRNIIQLNQLRYENKLSLDFSVQIHNENLLIIPIVLITLTENIFKHGDLFKQSDPAVIRIASTNDQLSYYSSNLSAFSNHIENQSGKGLKNIEFRLNSYYPQKYSFNYGMNNDRFVVSLVINF
ncbi:MAG: histidine kinase [Bacteroidetes bacterium]|jgi:sensor histidine kinase YesM|nr:histidine kinase [Bacteroidota bacterium]